ncbi:YozQ family protein [Paenibacillus harenae]|uniref:YozQ family protein n=1 Tax=Paenibacillus harenae TaxID=306543 RepID=UPI00040B2A92|nr:YozQ family protein [Paenibacillus harenae]
MKNNNEQDPRKLKGNALTHEQFSDVYAAGTSDGVHQLADEKIQIKNESYDSGQQK